MTAREARSQQLRAFFFQGAIGSVTGSPIV